MKFGGSKSLSYTLSFSGAVFYKHRFKSSRKAGTLEADFLAITPGLAWSFGQTGATMNLIAKGWNWSGDSRPNRREVVLKPGFWQDVEGSLEFTVFAGLGKVMKDTLDDETVTFKKIGTSLD